MDSRDSSLVVTDDFIHGFVQLDEVQTKMGGHDLTDLLCSILKIEFLKRKRKGGLPQL